MVRRKLDKFADNRGRANIIEPGKPLFDTIAGNWNKLVFKNDHPVVLELACGKGEYTVGLGRKFPGLNFIGVDIKGSRIWKGGLTAEQENLRNVAFLRIQIQQLDRFFSRDEVDHIWITFPDPRPRSRDERKRLTHPRFLDMYRNIIKPGGWIYLKTDNDQFFSYSIDAIRAWPWSEELAYTMDLYASDMTVDHHGLVTTYEARFLEEGIKIKYLRFRIAKNNETR